MKDKNPNRIKCDRCGQVTPPRLMNVAGDGSWRLCDTCLKVLDAKYPDHGAYPEDPYYANRITHEGQYEDETPEEWVDETYEVSALPDENDSLALLVRTTAGLRVEALQGSIVVTLDGKSVSADVEDALLWDAFNHPALYIDCSAIGLK